MGSVSTPSDPLKIFKAPIQIFLLASRNLAGDEIFSFELSLKSEAKRGRLFPESETWVRWC